MPSTHHFLVTLFSKILMEKHEAPESWSKTRIKLIFKGEDEQSPGNFRPIALTSVVGKLLHKIIALCRLLVESKTCQQLPWFFFFSSQTKVKMDGAENSASITSQLMVSISMAASLDCESGNFVLPPSCATFL